MHFNESSSFLDGQLLERGLVVLFFYTICLFGLFGYILYICLILRYRTSFSNPFYTLSLSLAVPDCFTLLVQLVYSIPLILLSNHSHLLPSWYTILVGYIADGSWFILSSHMLLIAINRLIAVTWYDSYLTIFDTRTLVLSIFLCYLYGLIMVSVMYTCSCVYTFPVYTWSLECNDQNGWFNFTCSSLALNLNCWLSNTTTACVVICYGFVLIRVRGIGKRRYSSFNTTKRKSSVEMNQRRKELPLALQFSVLVIVLVIYVASFWIVPKLVKWGWIRLKIGTIITNIFCLINSSLNPFLYMTFGSEVRRKLFIPKNQNERTMRVPLACTNAPDEGACQNRPLLNVNRV